MVATFAAGVLLARGLGVANLGYFSIATAIVTMAGIPGQFGLPKLVVREVAASSARDDTATIFGVLRWANRTCYAISGIVLLLVVSATLLVAHGDQASLRTAILIGSPMIPLVALLRIRGAALQGIHFITLGRTPDNLLRPALFALLLPVVFVVTPRLQVDAAMAASSISAGITFLIAHLWLASRLPPRPARLSSAGRRWLSSSLPMAAADAIRILQFQLSILVLGLVASPSEVGLFRTAAAVGTFASAPGVLVTSTIMPFIARLESEGDRDRLQTLITRATQLQFVATLLLSAPILLAGTGLLSLIFGHGFGLASRSTAILLVSQVLNTAFGPNGALLNMTHHEARLTRAMIVGIVLMAAFVFVLGGTYGAAGAALGTLISMMAWNFLAARDTKRLVGIDTTILRMG
jgi:O-antigen/teichoic acid export membrane protein